MSTPLGPGGRPLRGWRIVPMLLSLAVFAANAVILLADRAPGMLSRVGSRIDAGVSRAAGATGLDVPGGEVHVPQSDFGLHVVMWAVAVVLVGLAAWSWLSLFVASGLVLASSVALEGAQGVFTASRRVQLPDLLGNIVGVLLGTCVVAAVALAWCRSQSGATTL